MEKDHRDYVAPTNEDIASYAYHLWDSEGRQSGRDLDYWLQAKAHLTVDRQYEAGILQAMIAEHAGESAQSRFRSATRPAQR